MVLKEVAEEEGVRLLPHEALRHADAGDRLRKRGGDAGETLLRLALGMDEVPAEVAIERPDDRPHEDDEAEEDLVRAKHEDGGKERLAEADDAHEDDVLDAQPDGLEVRRHAADDAPDLHLAKEGGGEPLQMLEDGIAHVAHDQLAQFERVEDAKTERYL